MPIIVKYFDKYTYTEIMVLNGLLAAPVIFLFKRRTINVNGDFSLISPGLTASQPSTVSSVSISVV